MAPPIDTTAYDLKSDSEDSVFETPEFMAEWTDKEKADFAFHLLTTLPPCEVIQLVDRISPYLHRDILSQFPFEIALNILSLLDMPSLIQTSQVSRSWYTFCEEQMLWKSLYGQAKWQYDQQEIDAYLSHTPADEDYHASRSSSSNSNGNGSSNGSSNDKDNNANMPISSHPIRRTSVPFRARNKWSKIYRGKNNHVPIPHPCNQQNDAPEESRNKPQPNKKSTKPNQSTSANRKDRMDEAKKYHYDPITDSRFVNWQRLYRNRFLLENRWTHGSFKTRLFPSTLCPGSELHTEGIYCVQFDKGKTVTGSRDRTIKVWDNATERYKITMRGHEGSVLCLQYDQHTIVSGSSDSYLIVADLETGRIKKRLEGHQDSVLSLRLVGNDQVISCSKDCTIILWDKNTGERLRTFEGHRAAVNAVQWKGDRVVSASGDRTIKIWDMGTGKCLNSLTDHTRGVACVEFDGKYIVSGSSDQTIKVWDANTGECIYTLAGHKDLVRTIQLDAASKRIVSGCSDGHLKVWDLEEGKLIRDLGQAVEGRILNIKFDCTKIVCCSNLVKLVIYDFAHGISTKFLL